jgi:hypothetical protein
VLIQKRKRASFYDSRERGNDPDNQHVGHELKQNLEEKNLRKIFL